jgi:hypothetical protein
MFLGTRGVAGTAAGRRFTSVPALVRRRSDTHFASAPILSKTTRDINAFVLESAFVFFWLRAFRDTKTPRDGYHAYHAYQCSPNHVALGMWSL